jgi:serine/threonine protein phosphatase PrpC
MPKVGQALRIRSDVDVANLSDVGCQRTGNEDYFLYIEPQGDEDFQRCGRLILVADGMGGCSGGEVASRLAAEAVRDVFSAGGDADDPRSVLIEGFQTAHQAILDLASETPELRGMGTTCCAAILKQGHMYYAHVGDSRIYLIRGGTAHRLTEDHSLVARMVRDGILTAEEGENHDQRNVLTAALGVNSDSVAGDFPVAPLELVPEDIILLCTDGLHGLLSDREMALATAEQSLTDACREMVNLAKDRGGPDNITVQLLSVKCVET